MKEVSADLAALLMELDNSKLGLLSDYFTRLTLLVREHKSLPSELERRVFLRRLPQEERKIFAVFLRAAGS